MVDDRSIFRSRAIKPLSFPKSFPVGKFAVKMPVLDSNTSLGRLISYFHDFSAKALPYREGTRITGIVRRNFVLSTIVSLHMLSKTRVGDVMSAPLITTDANSNVAQAMDAMEKNKIARLVVLDNERLAGLISQRDISDSFTRPQERLPEKKSRKFSSANVSVSSVMRTPVYTIDFGRSAEEAARQMLEKKVSSLVVTRSFKPVGVITIRDIIESAAATTAKTQSKVIVSGLDEYTKDYDQQVRDSVNRLIAKIDKFENLDVDYVSVNIKRHKERNYEMHARLSLQRRGIVFAHATGYNLDSTLASLLESIYKRMRDRKEGLVDNKRLEERRYGE
jgi:CBS domain-containing protein